jgi:hypothetical protein
VVQIGVSVLERRYIKRGIMDWLSFIVGISGVITALLISIMNLYYNNKARVDGSRNNLYTDQLNTIAEYLQAIDSYAQKIIFMTQAADEKETIQEDDSFSEITITLDKCTMKAGLILPANLFLMLTDINVEMGKLIDIKLSENKFNELVVNNKKEISKFVVASRTYFGIDALSYKNVAINSNYENYMSFFRKTTSPLK